MQDEHTAGQQDGGAVIVVAGPNTTQVGATSAVKPFRRASAFVLHVVVEEVEEEVGVGFEAGHHEEIDAGDSGAAPPDLTHWLNLAAVRGKPLGYFGGVVLGLVQRQRWAALSTGCGNGPTGLAGASVSAVAVM